MKQIKAKNRSRVIKPVLITAAFLLMVLLFFVLFTGRASADGGSFNDIKGYERVLIRPGYTLDSLAYSYSDRYSHLSAPDYRKLIIKLNDLSSTYLREGVYLMLPICR